MNAATRASNPPGTPGGEPRRDGLQGDTPIQNGAGTGEAGLNSSAMGGAGNQPAADLIASLSGHDAGRERAVGDRTRRVVLSSLGVMREAKETRTRIRGLALAAAILVPLLIAPLVWEATDSFIAGEHLGDPGSQLSLWATVFCCTFLAAVLVAGWLKRRA